MPLPIEEKFVIETEQLLGRELPNVPSEELAEAVKYCGMTSGRDQDKFPKTNLTQTTVHEGQVPIIEQCHIHYACRVLHRHNLIPQQLEGSVKKWFYPEKDFHCVYYGEIMAPMRMKSNCILTESQNALEPQ